MRKRTQPLLLLRKGAGVRQGYGDRTQTRTKSPLQYGACLCLVQRFPTGTVRIASSLDLDHPIVKRLRAANVASKNFRTRLIADQQQIAKARRHHEQRRLTLAFEQCVRRHRRSHLDDGNRSPRLSQYREARDSLKRRIFVVLGGGEQLQG